MKKPEEIKKGLVEAVAEMFWATKYGDADDMRRVCGMAHASMADALFYIQQLESKLNQAVEDIRMLGRTGEFICPVCAHYNHGEGTSGECVKCLTGDGFRWRGEKEEDK